MAKKIIKSKSKKKGLYLSSKLKFRKPYKSLSNLYNKPVFFKSNFPLFGGFAIQAKQACFMTRGQIEAGRVAIRRPLRSVSTAKVFVRVKPTIILTKRSQETRMGRGKGAPYRNVAMICAGQILYEITGVPSYKLQVVFDKMKHKIGTTTALVRTYGEVKI